MEVVALQRDNLHQRALAEFAAAIEAGKEPPYGFRAGKEMLALTLAIFRSIETGAPVPVAYDF